MPTTSKKDFAGKTKTKDTYTGDWVFVKNRHTTGPNQSAGAWMTQAQARKVRQDNKPSGAPAPAAAPKPGVVPIPGVPVAAPGLTPTPAPEIPVSDAGIPSWWIGQAYQNPTDETQKFANVANALLPTLAPEDQRTLANYLAINNKDVYGKYADVNFGTAPTEITDAIRNRYLSPQRAQQALGLLDRMKQASGVADMGAGYDFLKSAVSLINQFAGNGAMTRENYQQFTNAVSNLGKNATGPLAPYGNLAQLFNLPQFSAGPLMSNTPNNNLFG
jgi:hypothetical protein